MKTMRNFPALLPALVLLAACSNPSGPSNAQSIPDLVFIANLLAETRNPFSPEIEDVRQGLAKAATLGLDEDRLAAVLVESAEERQALIDLFRIA